MRPQKNRIVAFNPDISYFKPRGIPMMDLEEVRLTVDECEALRLSDLLDLSHEDGGKQMGCPGPHSDGFCRKPAVRSRTP